ncbi:hypothetical protein [Halioxenophilus sp. WMMB6]|uniref:hypothetical protein n=1 Tax=Halioxenophilus sp. WMMB6 TaxID=3073815 RepID=UPI00295EBD66|nr:hypothetical protein [Halioxenophilus sp. WMMB6]
MSGTAPVNNYAERLERASQLRHLALQKILSPEIFSLTSMMGPVNDGPEWPSDAAWLALKHGDCACIISDGLSDPWVERDRSANGLGLEVYVESPEIQLADNDSLMALTDTWLFPMTAEISHTLAAFPRLATTLLRDEPMAIRFNIEHIKDGRGLVGAMLHTPPEFAGGFEIMTGNIRLVAATLLTGTEMAWLVGRGLAGRQELLDKLYKAGVGSRSLSQRPSVVEV